MRPYLEFSFEIERTSLIAARSPIISHDQNQHDTSIRLLLPIKCIYSVYQGTGFQKINRNEKKEFQFFYFEHFLK